MSNKHTIQLKKIKASFLLLVLFAVTVIQVSHSHTGTAGNRQEKVFIQKTGLPAYATSTAESKCFICEYQLAKDADASFFVAAIISSVTFQIKNAAYYTFELQHYHPFSVTRGPPAVA